MTWSLVTYDDPTSARSRAGLMGGDRVVRRHEALDGFEGVFEALQDWPTTVVALGEVELADCEQVHDAILRTPIRYPKKLICAGANYPEHLREMGANPPPDGLRPYFFLVPPTTTIVGPGEPVLISSDESSSPDYEAELAVVIGVGGRNISRSDARAHVAGYTLFNDITARGLLARDLAVAPPFGYDWLSAKGSDTSCPIGPGMVPSWMVPDPHALSLQLWRNGDLKQDGHTSQMIFDVWELVAAASERITLEPGDIIATGTPAGVGVAQDLVLQPGDELLVAADILGRLANPVATEVVPHSRPTHGSEVRSHD